MTNDQGRITKETRIIKSEIRMKSEARNPKSLIIKDPGQPRKLSALGFRVSDFGFRDSAFPWHLRSATLVVNLFMQSLRNHFLPRAANFGSRVSDFFRISSRLAGGFRIFLGLALFSPPVLAHPANDIFNMAQEGGGEEGEPEENPK